MPPPEGAVLQGAPTHGYPRALTCTNTVLTPVDLCAQPLLNRSSVRRSSYVRLALTVQGIPRLRNSGGSQRAFAPM